MPRVLVVEDYTEAADSLARLLKMFGYEVTVARDGTHAVESALRCHPDYVLLDIGLPDMDGFNVATKLKQEPSCREITIIATTGYGQADYRERALASGIKHHLVKPLDPDALLRVLSM